MSKDRGANKEMGTFFEVKCAGHVARERNNREEQATSTCSAERRRLGRFWYLDDGAIF